MCINKRQGLEGNHLVILGELGPLGKWEVQTLSATLFCN